MERERERKREREREKRFRGDGIVVSHWTKRQNGRGKVPGAAPAGGGAGWLLLNANAYAGN